MDKTKAGSRRYRCACDEVSCRYQSTSGWPIGVWKPTNIPRCHPRAVSISVRVVDCVVGLAAPDMHVALRHRDGFAWREVTEGRTGEDGRLVLWPGRGMDTGVYRAVFDLDGYFAMTGTTPLYPRAIVEFRVSDPDAELSLPLMVTSNSYHTCREGR